VREPRAARRSVGYCPQDNILCDRLSVREHIAFYMRIKGVLASDEELRRRAVEVGLGDFFYTRAGALSGGSKRKLMLAISFAGDPELLVLDEPTSGMGESRCYATHFVLFCLFQIHAIRSKYTPLSWQTPLPVGTVGNVYD